jgi:hypothetical protein
MMRDAGAQQPECTSTTREHQREHKERIAAACHPSKSILVPRPILASSHIMPVTSRSRKQREAGGAHLASLIEFFESQACEQSERVARSAAQAAAQECQRERLR